MLQEEEIRSSLTWRYFSVKYQDFTIGQTLALTLHDPRILTAKEQIAEIDNSFPVWE